MGEQAVASAAPTVAEGVAAAGRLIESGLPPARVRDLIVEELGVSSRTAQRYMARYFRAEGEAEAEERGQRRARLRQRLTMIYSHAFRRHDYRAALGALDRLARLDNLWTPDEPRPAGDSGQLAALVSRMHGRQAH